MEEAPAPPGGGGGGARPPPFRPPPGLPDGIEDPSAPVSNLPDNEAERLLMQVTGLVGDRTSGGDGGLAALLGGAEPTSGGAADATRGTKSAQGEDFAGSEIMRMIGK